MSAWNIKKVPITLPKFQVFRFSHVVLVIIGTSTFWYLQKLLEILHLKIQKSCTKAKLKTKLKVKKVLHCDSLKTTGFIRVKLWKLLKECHFFPQENGCFAQNNYFLWKEYVMGEARGLLSISTQKSTFPFALYVYLCSTLMLYIVYTSQKVPSFCQLVSL